MFWGPAEGQTLCLRKLSCEVSKCIVSQTNMVCLCKCNLDYCASCTLQNKLHQHMFCIGCLLMTVHHCQESLPSMLDESGIEACFHSSCSCQRSDTHGKFRHRYGQPGAVWQCKAQQQPSVAAGSALHTAACLSQHKHAVGCNLLSSPLSIRTGSICQCTGGMAH